MFHVGHRKTRLIWSHALLITLTIQDQGFGRTSQGFEWLAWPTCTRLPLYTPKHRCESVLSLLQEEFEPWLKAPSFSALLASHLEMPEVPGNRLFLLISSLFFLLVSAYPLYKLSR
ncbi:MAG: hypothetical protein ACTSR8_19465 [Promethearchaeota archaeon]